METKKFLICEHCKNIVGVIADSGVAISCCGEPMKELVALEGASAEKHTPVVSVSGNTVTIEVPHPMSSAHLIEWIYLKTNMGGHRKALTDSSEPKAVFKLAEGEKSEQAFAYCNLHGLWNTKI